MEFSVNEKNTDMNAITIYPSNQMQYDILVALAREMKMDFTTDTKDVFLSSLTAAAHEAKQIASGEIEAQTLDSLLAEA